jgi:hypothetical protein
MEVLQNNNNNKLQQLVYLFKNTESKMSTYIAILRVTLLFKN